MKLTTPYIQETDGYLVKVAPFFLPDQSREEDGFFVFCYGVQIMNLSGRPAQLIERKWIIRDGNGEQKVVKGEGVVGKQPFFKLGKDFTYHSYCPLPTPTGNMRGEFTMLDENEQTFKIQVPLIFFRDIDRIDAEPSSLYQPSPSL